MVWLADFCSWFSLGLFSGTRCFVEPFTECLCLLERPFPANEEPAIRHLATNLHSPKDLPINDQSYVFTDIRAGEICQLLAGFAFKFNLGCNQIASLPNPMFFFQVGLIKVCDHTHGQNSVGITAIS